MLLILGLMLGNSILIYISLVPLFFLLLGLFIDTPFRVYIKRKVSKTSVTRGHEIEINTKVKIKKGIGLVTVNDKLPENFQLTEGNNLNLLWKGFRDVYKEFTYTVKCPKRGVYYIQKPRWTSKHVLHMKNVKKGSMGKDIEIKVHPHSSEVKDLKEQHIGNIPIPKADVAKIGVDTTDFKEVRNYNYGDPFKIINWRATAKRGKKTKPLVNEYEVEGKKTIWIFLDADTDLKVGDSVENVLENCIEAADGFTQFFTEKGYLVGMYILNSNKKLFYPGTGKKQYNHIKKELLKVDMSFRSSNEGLDDAVEESKSFLYRYNPLPIIITNMYKKDTRSFKEGCKKLRAILGGRRKEKIPLVVLNVLPYSLHPSPPSIYKENAALFDKLENYQLKRYVRGIGGRVFEWDPGDEIFLKAFMRGAKKR
ncbi:MAG: DUF58 domain-containing protein [Thermoplasmatota archaeon]